MSLWISSVDGGLVVDADGNLLDCETCPCSGSDPGGTIDCEDCNPEELMPDSFAFVMDLCGNTISTTIDSDGTCKWTIAQTLLCGTNTLSDGAVSIVLLATNLVNPTLYCDGTDFVLSIPISFRIGQVGLHGLEWAEVFDPTYTSPSTLTLTIDSLAPFHASFSIPDITDPPAFDTPPVSDSPDAVIAFRACLDDLGCSGTYPLTGTISHT